MYNLEGGDFMICLVVDVEIKDGKQEELLKIIKPLIEGSQKEEGCIEYHFYKQSDSDISYVFIEKWKDQAALDFHKQTPHYLENAPKLVDLIAKPVIMRSFELVA